MTYPNLRLFLDGMLAMMALYALLCFWQQRKAIYWQYALYMVCMGITFRLDDRDYAEITYLPGADIAVVLVESAAFLLYIRFAILLMDIRQNDPFSFRLLGAMFWFLVGAVVLDTMLWLVGASGETRSMAYTVGRFALAAGALVVVPRILRLRQVVVPYFIIGSLCFILGCVVALIVNYIPGLFLKQPANPFTFPIAYMQVGVVIEVLCFTLGIARLNQQTEQEKIRVQAELIGQLRENERKQTQLQRIRDDIARDLHDDLGADLGSINLFSSVATRQLNAHQPEQASQTLQTIGETARRVIVTMREIVSSLSAARQSVDEFSLRLKETAYTLFEHQPAELHLDLTASDADLMLSPNQQRDLFLMYKEMLHNALRHARARNVWVTLMVSNGQLCLSVRDDGIGFRPGATNGTALNGHGLSSLDKRASDLGGQLTVISEPGQGTTVHFSGPIDGVNPKNLPTLGI
jgi:signal transduction histidine kinase